MMPLEGEAFFTSQMKDIPGARSAASNGKSVVASIASARARISSSEICAFSSSTRCLVRAAISSKIMRLPSNLVGVTDKIVQLLQRFAAVDGVGGELHALRQRGGFARRVQRRRRV